MRISAILPILLLLVCFRTYSVFSLELKACSAEDLRKNIEKFCIRYARTKSSSMEQNAYGSLMPLTVHSPSLELNSGKLFSKLVKPESRTRRTLDAEHPRRRVAKRQQLDSKDYLDACCSLGCEIETDDVMSICSSM